MGEKPTFSDDHRASRICVPDCAQPSTLCAGLDGGVLEPCVVHSVFSGDGKTLATVEIRPDAGATAQPVPVAAGLDWALGEELLHQPVVRHLLCKPQETLRAVSRTHNNTDNQ
eukprot:1137842-Pelagomonas_calceolata.AAC.4